MKKVHEIQSGHPATVTSSSSKVVMINNNDIEALLPIEEHDEKILLNARMLHGFLGVGAHFRSWIKRRIEDGSFIEGRDHSTFRSNLSETQGGCPPNRLRPYAQHGHRTDDD